MTSWPEETRFDIFDHVVWLVSRVIIHEVGVFSPICDSCLFEIQAMIFPPCKCCIFSLYFCFYFVIMEVESPRSRIGCMYIPLKLFVGSVGGGNFIIIDFLISID